MVRQTHPSVLEIFQKLQKEREVDENETFLNKGGAEGVLLPGGKRVL